MGVADSSASKPKAGVPATLFLLRAVFGERSPVRGPSA